MGFFDVGARERDDLRLMVSAAVSVTAVWAILGLRPDVLIAGNDSVAQVYPFLQKLVAVGGDWKRLIYDAGLLGGVKVHDVDGTLPLYQWLVWLGLGPVACHNVAILLFQVAVAYLGLASARNLALAWGAAALSLRALHYGVLCLPFAFMPMLAWRIGYGHLILIMGILPMLACVLVLSGLWARRLTLTTSIWAVIALANGFASQGQQLVVYGALFGLPMLLMLLWRGLRGAHPRRALAFLVLVVAGSWLVVAPRLAGMLRNAFGPDSVRSISGPSVVYSYESAEVALSDLFGSLWWARPAVTADRAAFVQTETNLAVGALVVLLLVAARNSRASRPLLWALLVSLSLAIAFSLGLEPVPGLLQAMLPPLGAFRVPLRSVLPVLMLLPVIGVAALLHWRSTPASHALDPRWQWAWGLAALVPWWLPASLREALLWCVMIGFCVRVWRPSEGMHREGWAVVVALLLAVGSVAGFQERLLPFASVPHLDKQAQGIGSLVKRAQPELKSPLTRALFDFIHPDLGFNQGAGMGISTLDGYAVGSRRFITLADAAAGRPHRPLVTMHDFPIKTPGIELLRQLYNVRAEVRSSGGRVHATATSAPGAAWFPLTAERVGGIEPLVAVMLADSRPITEVLWLDSADAASQAARDPEPTCGQSRILKISAENRGQLIHVHAVSVGNCPLVVATNYFSSVYASSGGLRVRTFAAYGPLVGLQLPNGEHRVRVVFDAHRPLWSWLGAGLGWGILFVALFVLRRRVYDGRGGV